MTFSSFTEIICALQEQGFGSGSREFSSNMISFELSSGSVNSYHTPASIDYDKSVERRNATDFPSNVGEEERVRISILFSRLMSSRFTHS